MRALMIAPQPFLQPRGTSISVYQRLKGLASLGHRVDLVTYHLGDAVEIPGVRVFRTPSLPFIKEIPVGPSWAKIPLDILLFILTLRTLLTQRYDVIHTHEEAAFFVVFLALVFRTPHLYDMHSSLPKQLRNFGFLDHWPFVKLFELLEILVLRTCRVVLTIGSDLERHVLRLNPRANHIRIENSAVDDDSDVTAESVAELKQSLNLEGRLPIVYAGTFERYQGLDLLFESARVVVATHPETAFIMVGGRPEQVTDCREKVAALGLADYVTFVGSVTLTESVRYLRMAEILVSPRTKGLSVPLKIYSYMRSGKPSVVTNIGAHTQILDQQTAVVVDPNPEALAQGLLRLVENPELCAEIGNNARKMSDEEFSREAYLAKLESAYLAIKLSKRISEIPQAEVIRRVSSAPSVGI